MASALRDMLTDTSTLPLIGVAVSTAAYSAYRANDGLFKPRDGSSSGRHEGAGGMPGGNVVEDNMHVLHGSAALAFPLIAAASITLLFFFLRSVGFVFTALSTVSGFFALVFVLWPFASAVANRLSFLPTRHAATLTNTLAVTPAVLVVLVWLFSGHWVANNAIGIALCVLFASLCRVPNLKVVAILFAGLFCYDIFFVFFSERVFGRNVMVEVATSAPTNPASALASWFNLPFRPVKNLALPAKLVLPAGGGSMAILGLGDIILPEILLTYLLEFDVRMHPPTTPLTLFSLASSGLFIPATIAYALALGMSFFCNYAFRAAQPALLYIVPCALFTAIALAISRRHFHTLWNGLHIPSSAASSQHDGEDHPPSGLHQGPVEFPNLQRTTESYTLLSSNKRESGISSQQPDQQV